MEVKVKSVDDLIPYARNSRTHSDEQVLQIASSIREFGFNNPVLIDQDGGIIAGHGRVLAARKIGMNEVPTIELRHLTETQKRAYVIADNKIALNAGWDDEMLKLELEELKLADFNIDLTGFSDEEFNLLMDEPETHKEGLTEDDAVPGVTENPITKPGDIWMLGKHRVMCGDSINIKDIEKLTDGSMVDMLLTDPPYNVGYTGKTKDALIILNDSMNNDSFRQFLRDAFAGAVAVMKPGAVFYIWHSDSEGYNFRGACFDVGLQVRQCIIWNKQTFVMGRQDYQWKHEPCLYGWKDGAGHLWASDRKQTTVINYDRPFRSEFHPTMKPVGLFEYQLLNNTKGGDIVLDLFGGSGTTLIASEKNGRHGYLMELDPNYCDVIVKRWQDFTGKDAILESTGQTFNSYDK